MKWNTLKIIIILLVIFPMSVKAKTLEKKCNSVGSLNGKDMTMECSFYDNNSASCTISSISNAQGISNWGYIIGGGFNAKDYYKNNKSCFPYMIFLDKNALVDRYEVYAADSYSTAVDLAKVLQNKANGYNAAVFSFKSEGDVTNKSNITGKKQAMLKKAKSTSDFCHYEDNGNIITVKNNGSKITYACSLYDMYGGCSIGNKDGVTSYFKTDNFKCSSSIYYSCVFAGEVNGCDLYGVGEDASSSGNTTNNNSGSTNNNSATNNNSTTNNNSNNSNNNTGNNSNNNTTDATNTTTNSNNNNNNNTTTTPTTTDNNPAPTVDNSRYKQAMLDEDKSTSDFCSYEDNGNVITVKNNGSNIAYGCSLVNSFGQCLVSNKDGVASYFTPNNFKCSSSIYYLCVSAGEIGGCDLFGVGGEGGTSAKYDPSTSFTVGKLDCNGLFGGNFGKFLGKLYNLMKFAVPIVILAFAVIDFIKATASQDQSEVKKAANKLVRRLIIGVLIFVLPTILELILRSAGIEIGVCDLG